MNEFGLFWNGEFGFLRTCPRDHRPEQGVVTARAKLAAFDTIVLPLATCRTLCTSQITVYYIVYQMMGEKA